MGRNVTFFCCTAGESGLVYRGYVMCSSGKELVAIKTCKGKVNRLRVLKKRICPKKIRIQFFCFTCFTHPAPALSLTKDMEKLMKEVSTMSQFKHPNVMPLIGVCFDKVAPLVIMPFMMNGSVLDYVKHNRDSLYCNSATMV